MPGAITFFLGLDASELSKGFDKSLRYAGDFVNQVKKAFSVRGIFDGLVGGLAGALGGSNLGDLLTKSIKGAMGKEVMQQKFEGLLGNANEASGAIREFGKFADEAAVAKDEVMAAGTKMFEHGMNPQRAIDSMKILAEISRVSGLNTDVGDDQRRRA